MPERTFVMAPVWSSPGAFVISASFCHGFRRVFLFHSWFLGVSPATCPWPRPVTSTQRIALSLNRVGTLSSFVLHQLQCVGDALDLHPYAESVY